MNELWHAIPGWEGRYEVSDQGNVRSLDRYVSHWRGGRRLLKGQALKPKVDRYGYHEVGLCKDGEKLSCKVHALVLQAFSGEAKGLQARHLNGNRLDNRLKNLVWGTALENSADRVRHGNQPRKLTVEQVKEIKELCKQGMTQRIIALRFGVSKGLISKIHCGTEWQHVA